MWGGAGLSEVFHDLECFTYASQKEVCMGGGGWGGEKVKEKYAESKKVHKAIRGMTRRKKSTLHDREGGGCWRQGEPQV